MILTIAASIVHQQVKDHQLLFDCINSTNILSTLFLIHALMKFKSEYFYSSVLLYDHLISSSIQVSGLNYGKHYHYN
jgi:hypothetical protein